MNDRDAECLSVEYVNNIHNAYFLGAEAGRLIIERCTYGITPSWREKAKAHLAACRLIGIEISEDALDGPQ